MTSPHDLINVAADDVAVATRLMATQPVNDDNVKTHIRHRLDCAQAGALVAIAALLHEHFHGHTDLPAEADEVDRGRHFASPHEHVPPTSDEALQAARRMVNGGWADAEPYETLKQLRALLG